LRIVHTSDVKRGQIYIPSVTAVLMVATVGLVLGFRSSSQLAAAYGAAVTTTMTITSVLFFAVARRRWGWSRLRAGLLTGTFLAVDLSFFLPNLSKLLHGAWFPFAIGLIIFAVATTWEKGRSLLSRRLYSHVPLLTELIIQLEEHPPTRVKGSAVYMAGRPGFAPPALVHNLRHNRVLHEQNAVLTIVTESTPSVSRDEKLAVKYIGEGFYKVLARFGYLEEPNVPYVLALAREKGLDLDLDEVSFFLGRERVVPDRRPLMSSWRERLFAFMSHNALGATTFFHIPPDQVIEVGAQVKL
jgi:KUP system potassium uptake protein